MQLIPVVNSNSRALQEFQSIISNANILLRNHVILLSIIQKKLDITDEEIQAATQSLLDESKKRIEARRLQSEEAGADEDSGGPEQSELLDAESSGVNPDSDTPVGTDGDGGGVCQEQPDTSDPVTGADVSTPGVTTTKIGDIDLVEPTEEGRRSY